MSDFISNWTNDRRQQQQQPTIKMMEKYRMLFFSSIYVTIISNNHRHALVYATGHARTPMHIAGNIIQNKHRNETNLVSVERIRKKNQERAVQFLQRKIWHVHEFNRARWAFFFILHVVFSGSFNLIHIIWSGCVLALHCQQMTCIRCWVSVVHVANVLLPYKKVSTCSPVISFRLALVC